MLKEFKAFIMRGNVLDLAVGVIIGGAFGKIVSSLVNDILTPLIGVLAGGVDFSALKVKIGGSTAEPVHLTYGAFIQAAIDFIIIAACIFLIVKVVNKMQKPAASATKPCPRCLTDVALGATRCPHCTSDIPA